MRYIDNAVLEVCHRAQEGGDIDSNIALYQVTEYELVGYPPTLRFLRQSGTMGLGDASRFACSLSFSFGECVSVISSEPVENPHYEWWYAGTLWRVGLVPPPEMKDKPGLEAPPDRGLVEESGEAAEDRRRRDAEKSRKVELYRRERAGYAV